MKKLNPTRAAYIAALIDGEGSVTLCSRQTRDEYRRLEVTISNADRNLLKWVLNTAGAGGILLKRPSQPRHSVTFTYKVVSRQALNLLSQIFQYLHTYKRKRAQLVLENYNKLTIRNGKYSQELLRQKRGFVRNFFAISSPKGKIVKIIK